MANIKWTGIEQKKYGLTADWYVSAYYGNDTDVDVVGVYDPSTNPTGHGGPTRPFGTLEGRRQLGGDTGLTVLDSGYYDGAATQVTYGYIGDGFVILNGGNYSSGLSLYNLNCFNILATAYFLGDVSDVNFNYGGLSSRSFSGGNTLRRNIILNECVLTKNTVNMPESLSNICFINCSGSFSFRNENKKFLSLFFINCQNLELDISVDRETGTILDYSVILGTVKTSVAINGKTTGVTIEDFKADGNYFVKSYSEVDLFGNASGSGASVAQINEIFNNYYSPIYIDDWQNADFTLRPDADDRIKFGGLNGTYIGAKPVGHRFSAFDLWNTYIDSGNTSNLEYDMVNNAIVLVDGQDVGTYRSVRISMSKPITVDLVAFFANFVYNIEGTAKQGVANQRIDTTVDLQPDNTENQRVVYDYRLQVAPDTVTALSLFKDYELNREPTVDADGYSQLNDLFDDTTEQKQVVQDFIIEFTLRRVIID